jgi:hypothetical protein
MKNLTFSIFLYCLIFLLGCSKQTSKWDEATKLNTIVAFDEYIKQFPSGSYVKEAKTKISNLVVQLIKNQFFQQSQNPESTDYPVLWNGKSFYMLGGQRIDSDGEMGFDGRIKPIPSKTTSTIYLPDNSLTMKCLFINDGNYKLIQLNVAENSIVQFKSGVKYTYRNGQFEK